MPVSQACNFIKKETLAQVFSCKFCEISKNTFSNRTPPVATSGDWSTMKKIFKAFFFFRPLKTIFCFN